MLPTGPTYGLAHRDVPQLLDYRYPGGASRLLNAELHDIANPVACTAIDDTAVWALELHLPLHLVHVLRCNIAHTRQTSN